MKSIRDYINLIESAEQPVEEDLKSKLAGAALAGAMALNPGAANADNEAPSWQQQVKAAIADGDLPPVRRINRVIMKDGIVTAVIINGETYDISHRLPDQSQWNVASQNARQHLAQVFREEQIDEDDQDIDPIAKIENLFKNS